ncbi:DUF4376 domain-containing protein [Campylobacter sp.]|uniref:DUF4376 domain-containing protein n=1 Tax=Campylobacter sp. TaxID=205 RepID=UPI0026DD9F08|nr:DUF4376 domain-containing protein [Campylobacter sp.]MDO4674895.1 DUF4376 domain-containing protein [Campylobacter sp.]
MDLMQMKWQKHAYGLHHGLSVDLVRQNPNMLDNPNLRVWRDSLEASEALVVAKCEKQREINEARDEALKRFEFEGEVYQTGEASLGKIYSKAALLSQNDSNVIVTWITEDNRRVVFSVAKFKEFATALMEEQESIVFKARALKDEVERAQSIDAAEAISWDR